MDLNQIINRHLSAYNVNELKMLVTSERTTFAELASSMKKDLERNYQSELVALSKGIPMKEYFDLILSIEPLILAKISDA